MSEEHIPKTPMTKAEVKYDPMYDHYGTLYPVLDIDTKGIHPLIVSFRRAISSFNPFAHQQVPSSDRIALGLRNGNRFYMPDDYPNSVVFDQGYPSHYDPLKHPRRPPSSFHKYYYSVPNTEPGWVALPFPRGCKRQIQLYERCVFANNKQKCKEQGDNILSICPNFVLDSLRNRKLNNLKCLAIDNETYKQAMEVGEYNKGRSVANISTKSWADGAKDKLRPDTMWADDRYIDITQKDINEAKARVAERKLTKANNEPRTTRHAPQVHPEEPSPHDDGNEHAHHYDWKKISIDQGTPLYP